MSLNQPKKRSSEGFACLNGALTSANFNSFVENDDMIVVPTPLKLLQIRLVSWDLITLVSWTFIKVDKPLNHETKLFLSEGVEALRV